MKLRLSRIAYRGCAKDFTIFAHAKSGILGMTVDNSPHTNLYVDACQQPCCQFYAAISPVIVENHPKVNRSIPRGDG